MAIAAGYFDLVREMKNAYNHRLRLVESVRERGIKPTARLFATSTLMVRKWWRRYQQHGLSGLKENSPGKPLSSSRSWLSVRSCPPSARRASSVSSIFR
jgi:transposase-like protein